MTTYRLEIAYDGTPFAGWAAQPGLRTVQGELEAALAKLLSTAPVLTVAGRTDAGVHAWGQVASFEAETDRDTGELRRAVNALTPPQVAVLAVDEAADGFDARRDARSRTYCYRVLAEPVESPFERDRALWWPYRMDREALDACAAAVVGTHDFTAFTPTDTEHVRFQRDVFRCEWREGRTLGALGDFARYANKIPQSDVFELWIEADAFMRNMVRVLVGTMLEVAAGRRGLDDFTALLNGAPRERAGETAPAHGLYLASVTY